MSKPAKLLNALMVVILIAEITSAATIRVPEDQLTIQGAIVAANTNDVIDVAPGTYYLTSTGTAPSGGDVAIFLNKSVTLKSRELYQAILDGGGLDMTLILVQAGATVEGFVLRSAKHGLEQRDSPNVTWTARNLIVRDMDRNCFSINDVGARVGSAQISNVVADNCGFGPGGGAGFSTNNADGFTISNTVVTNSFRAFILTDHYFFDVTFTAVFGNNGVWSRNNTVCMEGGLGGTLPCPLNLGVGFTDAVDPLLVDVSTTSGLQFPFFLSCDSALIDAGDPDPSKDDVAFPPSLGGSVNDIGAYGGPGAAVALTDAEKQEVLGQAGCTPVFTCVGFYPPMDNPPVTVKKNRSLPLKAELLDADLNALTDLDLIAPPAVQVLYDSGLGGPPTDVTDDALPAGQGTDGNQFEFSSGQWRFNLKTSNYTAPGTYTISLVSGDEFEYGVAGCLTEFVIEQ